MNEQQYAERIAYERRLGRAHVTLQGMLAHAALGLNYFTGQPEAPR